MANVSVKPLHNWRNKRNKNKPYPIHLCIRIDQKRKYFPIPVPLKVAIKHWSGKEDAWVKNNHPFAFEINCKIKEKKDIALNLIKRYYTHNKTLSFPIIIKELKKASNTDSFNAFFEEYINHPTDDLQTDTFKKYKACRDHLNAFNKNIRFLDLTPELIEAFYQYLKKDAIGMRKKTKGLEGSTIDSYFDAFRKVVSLARKCCHISKEHEVTLFEDLHIDVKKAKRTYLTIDEIKAWKKVQFTEKEKHLERTRDFYLLQIYTGFYYKDIKYFKREYLVKDHEYEYLIQGVRNKNDEQNIIPLFKFPDANRLIEKYSDFDKSNGYMFDPKYLLAEPVYNRQLKKVAERAGIAKNVTNKMARHTNAQLWIRLRTNKSIVKTMLGHAKEETTDIYFSINPIEVIEGTKHINFEELGI